MPESHKRKPKRRPPANPREDQHRAAMRETLKEAQNVKRADPDIVLLSDKPGVGQPIPPMVSDWVRLFATEWDNRQIARCGRGPHCADSQQRYLFGYWPNVLFCKECAAQAGLMLAKAMQDKDKTPLVTCDLCDSTGGGVIRPVVMPMADVLVRMFACELCLNPH